MPGLCSGVQEIPNNQFCMAERPHLKSGTEPIANSDLARATSLIKSDLPKLFNLMEIHRDLDKDLTRGFEQRMISSAEGLIGEVLSVNAQPLELGKPSGVGTRGIVFAARRVGEESFNLAIKVSQPYMSAGKADPERDSPQRCFEQEVRFLTLLQNDPSVRVPVLYGSCEVVQPGSGREDRIGLILMELVPGKRISQMFGSVPQAGNGARELAILCGRMLEGIDAVLSKGISIDDAGIHNAIVTTDLSSPIVIIDFGAGRVERDVESARRDTAWFVGSQLEEKAMVALSDGRDSVSGQTMRTLALIKRVGRGLRDGELDLKGASEILKSPSANAGK